MLSTLIVPWIVLGAMGQKLPSDVAAPARLVTLDGLQARLNDPKTRILDTRSREDFEKGHIPGAVWVDVKAAEEIAGKPGGLADKQAWEGWIRPLGIGPESEVVVTDGARQLGAARIWWLLTYLGVSNVALVDGNIPLWASQNRPMTTDLPEVEPRDFPVAFRDERHATQEEVLSAIKSKSATVIDARSTDEYTGAVKRSKKGGHVPTACSLEWTNFVDRDGKFLEAAALNAKLEKAGVKPGQPVITHCQGGGRASVNAFVFERLGYPTRNYYLGWSDWGNAEGTPVETDPDAGQKP